MNLILLRRGASLRRTGASSDEGAVLVTVLLIILVLAGLSLLVLGSLLREVRPTGFTQSSSRSLFAAEAGVQAGLAQVRTAVAISDAGEVFGDRGRLPCSIAGTVGGTDQALAYAVAVRYYPADPAKLTEAQRETQKIVCIPASGPVSTPAYALITSRGTSPSPADGSPLAQPAPRTLESIYGFKVSTKNVLGGLMWTVTQKACLQASSTAVGATVMYADRTDCISGTPTQMWVYDTDYAIKLGATVGTTSGGTSGELCITGSSGNVTLQPCVKLKANQLWSYEGGARFRGQNSTNTVYADTSYEGGEKNVCLSAGKNPKKLVTSTLKAGPDCANSEEWGSFSPEPRVGAGAASKTTDQIVNFLEFGRCFDVTGEYVGAPFMISYPCKQDPSPEGKHLKWNHKWYYTEPADPATVAAPQLITVEPSTTSTLCLQTPAKGVAPAYVTLKTCSGGGDQQYVRRTDTGSSLTSYTFRTSDDRCLSLGPQGKPDGGSIIEWSTLVAATCTGGSEQKWNAPATLGSSDVTGTREVPTVPGVTPNGD